MIFVQEVPDLCKVTTRSPQLKLVSESSLFWQLLRMDGLRLLRMMQLLEEQVLSMARAKNDAHPMPVLWRNSFCGRCSLHMEMRQVCLGSLVLCHSLHIDT